MPPLFGTKLSAVRSSDEPEAIVQQVKARSILAVARQCDITGRHIYTRAGGRDSSCSLLLNRGGATEERLLTSDFYAVEEEMPILVPSAMERKSCDTL